jgi:hypothetical protein
MPVMRARFMGDSRYAEILFRGKPGEQVPTRQGRRRHPTASLPGLLPTNLPILNDT